ncbi:MAG: DsbC family protein [Thermodesulfovibrionales bacterium]|nr:DsbC family protein [Thermodesulfovibrionales bacterium]
MLKDRHTTKKLMIPFILLALVFNLHTLSLSKARAFPVTGGGGECSDCHRLKPEEAEKILKAGSIPELKTVKVTGVTESPAKGIWEIFIQKDGKKGIIYLDFSKKFIMIGQIVELSTSKNITQERFTELNKIDTSKIPLDDALLMGDRKAKYRVIVFTDPDCPFCGRLHREMKEVIEKRKDIAFYIKLFPLPNHQDAYWKSKSIYCKRSLKLLEDNFEGKAPPKPDCETDQIDKNISLGRELGINSTPTIILPDGRVIPGAIPADKLIELIAG